MLRVARVDDDHPDVRVVKKDLDSEFRFLRSTEGIAQATSEVRHCMKIIQKQGGMDEVVDTLNRVVLLLNTAKDRLRADATISSEAAYVHNRTKRNRGSLLEEEDVSTTDQAGAQRKKVATTVPHSQGVARSKDKQNESPYSAVASVDRSRQPAAAQRQPFEPQHAKVAAAVASADRSRQPVEAQRQTLESQHAKAAAVSTLKAQAGVATANPAPAPSRERTTQEVLNDARMARLLYPLEVPFDTIENPLDANGNEPPPINDHHYDLFEAISILKFKTPHYLVTGRWKEEGKIKCSDNTIRRRFRRARQDNSMPVRGDFGNKLGAPLLQSFVLKRPRVLNLPSNKEPKQTREQDKEGDDPIPANGKCYCLHEVVTYFLTKGSYLQYQLTLLRWIKTGKILCSSKTLRRRMRKAQEEGIVPLKGDYGITTGRPGFLELSNVSKLHGLTTREEIKAKLMEIQKRELQKQGAPISKLKEPSRATILNYTYLSQSRAEQGEEEGVHERASIMDQS
jgi:hypothetical protein